MIVGGHIKCSTCGENKPLTAYQPSVVKKACGQCRACKEEYKKRNRARFRRRDSLSRMAWREKNLERDEANLASWNQRVRKHKEQGYNLRRYGLTVADYNSILLSQGGKCACCSRAENSDGRRLYVDHCHDTGIVRGLLCQPCNTAIGLLGDNAEGVERAVNYLLKSKKQSKVSLINK